MYSIIYIYCLNDKNTNYYGISSLKRHRKRNFEPRSFDQSERCELPVVWTAASGLYTLVVKVKFFEYFYTLSLYVMFLYMCGVLRHQVSRLVSWVNSLCRLCKNQKWGVSLLAVSLLASRSFVHNFGLTCRATPHENATLFYLIGALARAFITW